MKPTQAPHSASSKNNPILNSKLDSGVAVPQTLSRRLWVMMSSVILVILIAGIITSVLLKKINEDLVLLSKVVEPMEQALLEMEINAGEAALAVYAYVRRGNPDSLVALKDAESDFKRYAAQFHQLANDKGVITLDNKIDRNYLEFTLLGKKVISLADQQREQLIRLSGDVEKIYYLMGNELLAIAYTKSSAAANTQQVTLKLKLHALETLSAVEFYVLNLQEKNKKNAIIAEKKFIDTLMAFQRDHYNLEEKEIFQRIRMVFDDVIQTSDRIIQLADETESLLVDYAAYLIELDVFLDNDIQPLVLAVNEAAIEDAFQSINRAYIILWLLSLLAIVVAVVMVMRLSRSIVSSVDTLVQGAREIGKGEMHIRIQLDTNDEFAYLGETFNRTLNRLLSAQQEANRSRVKTQAILDTAADGIISINSKDRVTSFNIMAEQMFGYSADEVLGNNIKMLMLEPFHQEGSGDLADYDETGAEKIIGIGREVTGQRKDGSTFPVDLAVSKIVEKARMPDSEDIVSYTGILRDITERKRVDQAKAEFISTVSHELRTPLTSIKGSLGLIHSGELGQLPDQLQSMLDIAYKNTDRLVLLINDILDIEKITAGKLAFDMQAMDVTALLDGAIEANKGYADKHDVTFVRTSSDEPLSVKADSHRLMQILSNLMSNAAKFSPKGGEISISAMRCNNMIRIAVKDNGQGIPEAFRGKIFDKFSQADSSDTRQKGGTGLGLSITKAFVEKHGSELKFNTKMGAGTTFYFDIAELLIYRGESATSDHDDTLAHVLICEDNSDVATLLQAILGSSGLRTSVATTLHQAKIMLESGNYNAMTLDLDLPDGDGIALVKELLSQEKIQQMPIIVVSANAIEREREHRDDNLASIVGWMQKPIEAAQLTRAVRAAMQCN